MRVLKGLVLLVFVLAFALIVSSIIWPAKTPSSTITKGQYLVNSYETRDDSETSLVLYKKVEGADFELVGKATQEEVINGAGETWRDGTIVFKQVKPGTPKVSVTYQLHLRWDGGNLWAYCEIDTLYEIKN